MSKHSIVTYRVKVRLLACKRLHLPPRWEYIAFEEDGASHYPLPTDLPCLPSLDAIRRVSGSPWYCKQDRRFKPQAVKVIKTVEETEVEVRVE